MSCSVYEIHIKGHADSGHVAAYVETGEGGVGTMFHVRCAIGKSGMVFEKQEYYGPGPESLATFTGRVYKGSIKKNNLGRFETVCGGVATPASQYAGTTCQCNTWIQSVWAVVRADGVLES